MKQILQGGFEFRTGSHLVGQYIRVVLWLVIDLIEPVEGCETNTSGWVQVSHRLLWGGVAL